MVKIYIIRHGNTFFSDQPPLRVGLGTDIRLVPSGRKQATELGYYFKTLNIKPKALYSSALLRAKETAQLIQETANYLSLPITIKTELNEIEYGPDEGQPEDLVEKRLGALALEQWNKKGLMPAEWQPRPEQIIKDWEVLLNEVVETFNNGVVLMVTSNGRARFVPQLNCVRLCQTLATPVDLKLRTGSFGLIEKADERITWQLCAWNVRP
jgi:2,3-bisphosphoglycerate-dependent phosphoglycerate mutase